MDRTPIYFEFANILSAYHRSAKDAVTTYHYHPLPPFLPRHIQAGPVLLDLFHRDAAVNQSWIGLFPREFQVIWRLVELPNTIHSRLALLNDVWRLNHDPETNRVEVAVARIRSKLRTHNVDDFILTSSSGGYILNAAAYPVSYVYRRDRQTGLDTEPAIGDGIIR